MRRIISDHFLLNWHNAAKVPISRDAGLRRDVNAASSGVSPSPAAHAGQNEGFWAISVSMTSALPRPKTGRLEKHHGFRRQLQMPSPAEGRLQNLCLFQPSGGGEKRAEGNFAAAFLPQSAVGKFAAQRRWTLGDKLGYPGSR